MVRTGIGKDNKIKLCNVVKNLINPGVEECESRTHYDIILQAGSSVSLHQIIKYNTKHGTDLAETQHIQTYVHNLKQLARGHEDMSHVLVKNQDLNLV